MIPGKEKAVNKKREEKIITIGEVLLRLTPPGYEKIKTASAFEAQYGGSEANVAASLANLGMDASVMTVVPDNSIGKGAVRMLKSNSVNCDSVIFANEEEAPSCRLGTYYLETGYGIRPSQVVYDRKHSAFCEYDFEKLDMDKLLDGYTWLHVSGITPALGENGKKLIRACLKKAKEKNMTVSFDGNFRSALWNWEEAREFCTECLPYIHVLFGIEPYHLWKNSKNPEEGDVKDGLSLQPDFEQQAQVFAEFKKQYPNLRFMARHVREAKSSSRNSLWVYVWQDGKTYKSRKLSFDVLDRVGSGDAFAAGIIYGIMNGYTPEDTANFAVAAGALKHTVRGDVHTTDELSLIHHVMADNFDIKR